MTGAEEVGAERALVIGLGVTGAAVTAALLRRGADVVVVDDAPGAAARQRAQDLGVELRPAPAPDGWAGALADRTAVLPSPGVPDAHPVLAAATAAGLPVLSEFDLASAWDDRPVVAVTGTNGKTTVVTLITAMLDAAGRRAVDAGNTDVPLVAAIDDPDVDVFVVEASSFRLGHSHGFAPRVGTWLNFAPDHLDVHASMAAYEEAKARVWAALPPDGTAVANADDPVVLGHAPTDGRTTTFGLGGPGAADWTVIDDVLVAPGGEAVLPAGDLWRDLPHDRANALAAAASAVPAGADLDAVRAALVAFTGLRHRVELVGEAAGVRWYDDSKATTPHATLSAVGGFPSVVLVAGGRNKGIDLGPLADATPRVRAVVAIGEAGADVAAAFEGRRPVVAADSMAEAVAAAGRLARPGDVVLLSPGCASFDWYRSYGERGDDFTTEVRRHLGGTAAEPPTTSSGRSR